MKIKYFSTNHPQPPEGGYSSDYNRSPKVPFRACPDSSGGFRGKLDLN